MRLIIAGSRDFRDYSKLCYISDIFVKKNLPKGDTLEIVSGGAIGADKLGEMYAEEKGYDVVIFKPLWDKYGKKAGMIRNEEMAKYADSLVAFWNGTSRGTLNMCQLAKKYKLNHIIFKT